MSGQITRLTMFKVSEPLKQEALLKSYDVLAQTQQKDGKPYILSINAGRAMPDPRSGEYTIVVRSEFANLEDMKYYDSQCPAHQKLKQFAGENGISPPLVVYLESVTPSTLR